MQIRELGLETRRHLSEVRQELARVSQAMSHLGDKVEKVAYSFAAGMEQQAVRQEDTLEAITKVLDNSVDLHKMMADHERRIRRLEDDQAS